MAGRKRKPANTFDGMVHWAVTGGGRNGLVASRDEIGRKFGVSKTLAMDVRRQAVGQARARLKGIKLPKLVAPKGPKAAAEPPSPPVKELMRQADDLRAQLGKQEELKAIAAALWPKCAARLSPVPIPRVYRPSRKRKKRAVDMGVQLSDLQCGAEVSQELTMGLGAFNLDILRERLWHYGRAVVDWADENRLARPVEDLHIFAIGDFVEGETIYAGQKWFLDAHLLEQLLWLQKELAQWLAMLAGHFRRVRVYGTAGNHGRWGRKKDEIPGSNADLLLLHQLQMMTDILPALENVDVFVSKTYLMAVEIKGKTHLLRHGQDVRRYLRFPYYSATTNTVKFVNLMDLHVDYAHIGHHHTPASWPASGIEIIMNGSFPGATDHSINDIQEGDLPVQNAFLLHPEFGVWLRNPVRLAEAGKMAADEHGVFTPVAAPGTWKGVVA